MQFSVLSNTQVYKILLASDGHQKQMEARTLVQPNTEKSTSSARGKDLHK